MASYTANLTSFLISRQQKAAIETLNQLAKSNTFKPLLYKGTNTEQIFKAATDSYRKTIFGKFSNDAYLKLNNTDTLYNLLSHKNYVFIGEYSLLTYYQKTFCDLVITEPFDHSNFGN